MCDVNKHCSIIPCVKQTTSCESVGIEIIRDVWAPLQCQLSEIKCGYIDCFREC